MLRSLVLAVSLFFSSAFGFAQVATGSYAFGTFDNHGFDTTNVGNLNTHFSIPVLNKAGRGLSFYYNLSYDSSVWYPTTVNGAQMWEPVQNFGWRGDTEMATGYLTYNETMTTSTNRSGVQCTSTSYFGWVYHDPSGTTHTFKEVTIVGNPNVYNTPGCNPPVQSPSSFTAGASDGSGYTLQGDANGSGSLTTRTGSVIYPPVLSSSASGTTTDSNGNQVSTDGNGNFTDTTGTVVLQVAGGAPNAQTYTYKDTGGTSRAYTVNYSTYTVQTNFGCSSVTDYPATSISLVSSITLPLNDKQNNQTNGQYTFTYEPTPGNSNAVTGRLASVTLPTGGTISYSYSGANNGIDCNDGSTLGLTRTAPADSGTSWTYARSYPRQGGSHTLVTDGLSNNSDYDFVAATVPTNAQQPGAYYFETNRNNWNGPNSGPHQLSQQTCYNNSGAYCITTAIQQPVTQLDTFRIMNDVQETGKTVQYDANGNTTEIDSYDYGQAQNNGTNNRGALLSKELLTYGNCGPATLVGSDIVQDGSGNTLSKKTYCYDETTPAGTSNVPSHVGTTGVRGNLTTATTYTSSSGTQTTGSTYNDTGAVLSSTSSINGTASATTTYGYDSTFTYLTGTVLPTPSSGVAMSTGAGLTRETPGCPRRLPMSMGRQLRSRPMIHCCAPRRSMRLLAQRLLTSMISGISRRS